MIEVAALTKAVNNRLRYFKLVYRKTVILLTGYLVALGLCLYLLFETDDYLRISLFLLYVGLGYKAWCLCSELQRIEPIYKRFKQLKKALTPPFILMSADSFQKLFNETLRLSQRYIEHKLIEAKTVKDVNNLSKLYLGQADG